MIFLVTKDSLLARSLALTRRLYQPGSRALMSTTREKTVVVGSSMRSGSSALPTGVISTVSEATKMPSETRPPSVNWLMKSPPSKGRSSAKTGAVLSTEIRPAEKPVMP